MTQQHSIIFVLPTSIAGQQGPVAGWLNTAGWAAAATDVGFRTTIITPGGRTDIDTVRRLPAAEASDAGRSKSVLARLPTSVKVGLKDVRECFRALAFTRLVGRTPRPEAPVAFVWQRHELFHTAGLRLARRLRCPSVLYVVAPKVWEARTWGIRRPGWGRIAQRLGDSRVLRQADVVACVSDEVSTAVQRLGVPLDRIIVTPSTVDTNLFDPSANGSKTRKQLGISSRFVIGWTGSFRRFHGLDTLLDVMARLKDEIPEVLLVLVGDGPERARLADLVEQRGLAHWVRFIGAVRQDELPPILAAFDVGILLGRAGRSFHYSPLKLWEYLAMGRPVVAAADGSVLQTLTDGVNAMVVPPEKVDSICDAVVSLHRNPRLREQIGTEGRSLAEANSWTHQLERVCVRIDELVPGSETPV